MSDPVKDHVRLKPYDPKAGQTKRDYNAPWGFTYKHGVWYVEPASVAVARSAYLETVRMNSSDDYSPRAFDVCTREDAEKIKLFEESNELEQVMAASRPAVPPAPMEEAPAAMSQDLNLPSPKSELAAAAAAKLSESASQLQAQDGPPPTESEPKTRKPAAKKAAKPRSRRRRPGS